ncbi:MAG: FHA domain-containing protein [Thermoleophilia bacterium]
MSEPPAWPGDPRDRMQIRDAERAGKPFLVMRDEKEEQRIVGLGDERPTLVVGRSEDSDVPVPWDDRVSRTHAQLFRVGTRWYVEDDGLSRNGTWVNEERVTSRRPLLDGDVLRVGHTALLVRIPSQGTSDPTRPESRFAPSGPLPAGQRRVLEALCRPCLAPGGPHPPASNDQIAGELHLSVDAVKAHLRQLFRRFDIEHLPQIQKRTALVRIAIESGVLRSGT